MLQDRVAQGLRTNAQQTLENLLALDRLQLFTDPARPGDPAPEPAP